MICDPKPPNRTVIGGRYTIYDEIGAGGMAAVHIGKLHGAAGFARTVAIKRLHPALAHDEEFVAMFVEEARLAARIRHPNVVQTLDVVVEDGELFLVMEYVLGEPLSHILRRLATTGKRIAHPIVAAIMVDVLHGLHAAHETKSARGRPLDLVHRDVSPQNILLGADGVARVLDFGIAKSAASGRTSRSGTVRGKFPYLAPEQIAGEPVRKTADIYSASVVFWELLTNERLFVGDTPQATMARVLAGCGNPPSAQVAGVPDIYDGIVMRGLSRDPARRFPTASAMAEAIEERIQHVGTSAIASWIASNASDSLKESSERLARVDRDGAVNSESMLRYCSPTLVTDEGTTKTDSLVRVAPQQTAGTAAIPTPSQQLHGTATIEASPHFDARSKSWRSIGSWLGAGAMLALLMGWGIAKLRHPSLSRTVPTSAAASAFAEVRSDSTSASAQPAAAESAALAVRLESDNHEAVESPRAASSGPPDDSSVGKPAVRRATSPKRATSPFRDLGGRL